MNIGRLPADTVVADRSFNVASAANEAAGYEMVGYHGLLRTPVKMSSQRTLDTCFWLPQSMNLEQGI